MYQKSEGEKHTLRDWRRLNNMSMKALADACGVHVNTIPKWEKETGKMKLTSIATAAKALNIEIDDIILP